MEITTRSINPESNIAVESVKVVISGANSFAATNLSGFVSATAVSSNPLVALTARLC